MIKLNKCNNLANLSSKVIKNKLQSYNLQMKTFGVILKWLVNV